VELVQLVVKVPDRPGALGAVATRIGAVQGDILDVAILHWADSHVVDRFLIGLPDDPPLSLLDAELREVDGLDVEEMTVLGPDQIAELPDPVRTRFTSRNQRA